VARRKTSGRRTGFGRKAQSPVVAGLIAGVASRLGAQVLGPQLGPGAGLLAAGAISRNDAVKVLGGVSFGSQLAANLNVGGILPGLGGAAPPPSPSAAMTGSSGIPSLGA
jgi:hypothetical protein